MVLVDPPSPESGSKNVTGFPYFLIAEAKAESAGITISGPPVARQRLSGGPPGSGFHFLLSSAGDTAVNKGETSLPSQGLQTHHHILCQGVTHGKKNKRRCVLLWNFLVTSIVSSCCCRWPTTTATARKAMVFSLRWQQEELLRAPTEG